MLESLFSLSPIGSISVIVILVFVTVLLIVYCTTCGRGDYERIGGVDPLVEARDANKAKQQKIINNRKEAWSDAQYYVRGLQGCKLLDEYDLWEMGKREDKSSFLVKMDERILLMTMLKSGPNLSVPLKGESGRNIFKNIISSLKHPYIQIVFKVDYWIERSLAVTITYFSDEGSLRDTIHKTKPTKSYAVKYAEDHRVSPIESKQIAYYGRQILEALLFMSDSGVPFTHLHAGNVIVKSGNARITNIENGLLNLERQNERLFRQYAKKLPTKFPSISLDVISFGALLYEMLTGYQLKNISEIDSLSNTNADVTEILRKIFKDENVISLDDIVGLPFFANVKLRNYFKPEPIKFEDKIKKYLESAMTESKKLHGGLMGETPSKRPRSKRTQQTGVASPRSPNTPSRTVTTSTPVTSSPVPPPPPAAPVPPPPPSAPVPPPPPSAPVPPPQNAPPQVSGERGALLGSIRGFSSKGLKKTVTNDRSAPKL